ncbi:ABC transporter substrate-binding protein [Pseudoalteromonas sp. G4]|uniref:ABC transporter substrate-binding protein n=1 Tax=Pseudoalteromonas sp. G4 TaxID=2992761 RepID=UPI00237EA79D|nr:ABC transporter substrate-binding protein [Pseudoalteromonas sp. G4]MDE3272311.1 ABC transporter substrate-binding protein [Pseudoalteromonas sp. G4]
MRRLTLLLFTFIFLTSCQEQNIPTLRIGTNIWPGYEPFYITRQKYPNVMKHIKLIEYRNASQVLNGIINESIDVAAVTLDEAVKIKALGFDIEVIWVIDYSNGADTLMAKPNITHAQDLKGKRVGAEMSALGLYFLSRYLELNSLSIDDITLINLEANRHVQAYKNNEIDAVFTFDPSSSKLIDAGAIQLFDSSQIPGEIVDVLITNKKTLSANKKSHLLSFLKMNNQTVKHIVGDITPYINSLNQRLNLSEQQLKDTFNKITLLYDQAVIDWLENTEKQALLIKSYDKVLLEQGKIDKLCQCNNLINPNIAKQVFNEN